MNSNEIKTIAVIGAGTMGAGITQVCAQAGYRTLLYDQFPEAVARAEKNITSSLNALVVKNKINDAQKARILSLITFTNDFSTLVADLCIEAIVELTEPKIALFKALAAQNAATTILATNTSSIPVSRIAAAVTNPERVVGFHFFNPATVMKLVEIIQGASTDIKVCKILEELALKLGKIPVMAADSPGFIVNRVARHYYVESLKIMEEGVADYHVIDALLESSGFKMGPFRLMDLIGIDTNFSVTKAMFESFHYDPKFRPSRIQQQKVEAGHWGRKTGKGFYNYE